MRAKGHNSGRAFCCAYVLVVACTVGAWAALPPDPDNAALLYYQAALIRPEADPSTYVLLTRVLGGAEPNDKVRRYVDECRQTIALTEAAAERANCTWGVLYSQADSLQNSLGALRQLGLVLEVDARIQVANGDATTATDKVLNVRQLARHIGDETVVVYGTSLQLGYRSLLCTQYVLSSLKLDGEALTWLQAQLSGVQGPPQSPARQIAKTLDYSLQSSRVHPESITRWREFAAGKARTADAKASILALTDGQVLEQARESGDRFSALAQRVIGSAEPYDQKYVALCELVNGLNAQIDSGDPVGLLFLLRYSADDLVVKQYDVYVRGLAQYNAVRAAIEIYVQKARTGQLPREYPQHLPRDPFSGENFAYEVTDGQFVLRCQAKEIGENKFWEYVFKTK